MKTLFRLLILSLPIMQYSSCNNKVEIKQITSNVKTKAIPLSLISTEHVLSESDKKIAFVYNDCYLIAITAKDARKNEHLLNIYLSKEKNLVYSAIPFGKEEENFLSVLPFFCNNKLILQDIIKDKITIVEPLSVIKNPFHPIKSYNTDIVSNAIIPYKGNILYLNPYWTEKNNRKEKKLLTSDSTLRAVYHSTKPLSLNINRGTLIASEKKNRIFFFDSVKDKIEIFDYNCTPLKVIVGPDFLKPIYHFARRRKNDLSYIKEGFYDSYLPCTISATENNIYVAYIGEETNFSETPDKTWIFCFDWDGNLNSSFLVKGRVITTSLSKDNNALYLQMMESDTLYKVVIPNP